MHTFYALVSHPLECATHQHTYIQGRSLKTVSTADDIIGRLSNVMKVKGDAVATVIHSAKTESGVNMNRHKWTQSVRSLTLF